MKTAAKVPSFSLSIRPSQWMACYLTVLHCLVFYCLVANDLVLATIDLLPLGWLLPLAVSIIVLGHWVYSLWRFASPRSCHWIKQMDYRDQGWSLTVAGKEVPADLVQATVWSWLVVVNFCGEENKRRYSVIVLPDTADANQRRKLRVMLRHMAVWG
ncbi:MAG: protein YgfX [Pseudomonadales bacterium]